MDKYDEDQQMTMTELQKELKEAVSGFTDAGGTKNDLEKYFDEHKDPELRYLDIELPSRNS